MAVSVSPSVPLPPGSFGVPLIGETVDWVRDPLRFAQGRAERFGLVWRTHLLGRPCAVLLGPDANKFILGTHMHLFSSRAGWGKPITSLIGNGLSLIDGEEHRRHRRMIQPALHGQMLHRYFQTMYELTIRHAAQWTQAEPMKMFDAFKHLSFEIAARLMLGVRTEAEVERLYEPFHIFTHGLFAPPAWKIPGTPYGKAWNARTALHKMLHTIIVEHRGDFVRNDDLLSLLIEVRDEQGNGFTDDELVDELLVLLWAGHDTVTSLLTWALYEIVRQPELLQRLRAEQAQIVGNELALAHLKHLPLLDATLREAERLHPPAPGGFRGVVEEFSYGGYRIPAGWTVMYSSVYTHNMSELWHDPARFDPDRFLPPRDEGKKPFHIIGFGGGPRVCAGLAFAQMQMRIIVSHLLRLYEITLLPGQSFKPVPVPTKMPKDGLIVRVAPRS